MARNVRVQSVFCWGYLFFCRASSLPPKQLCCNFLGLEGMVTNIPEDNPLTQPKVELGRELFFDERLSVDATISCASCHTPLFRETPSRPAITVGVHDIAGFVRSANRHFYSLYGVATKSIDILPHVSIKPTVGYGVDWPKPELMKEFNGIFGGVSLGYRDFFFLKAEYNDLLNVGLGIDLLNFLAVNLILIDGKDLGVGANFKKRL